MSAIVGITNSNQEPIDLDHMKNLMNAFNHYPADDRKSWQKDRVFLGCHAQWITPESIGEKIPYYDYGRQLTITSDAIIDNRNELFDRLQVDQSQRKSMSDSQLILLAYSKWGEDVPKHLIGDFAFMIWDEKKRKLFGARDFSGARTLYYYSDQNRFAFSTTIEPLFTLPYIEKSLNEEWLAEFLAIPGMVEAADMTTTVYKSIKQLPPSHSITIEQNKFSISRYDTIDHSNKIKLNSNEEYEEAFQEVFQAAVTSRLRTHGEVGSQLSGGLDSGTVVSFAARSLQEDNKRLHTFSYIPEDDFIDWTPRSYLPDERPFIKETVEYVGNISDNYLDFKGRNSLSEIDDLLEIMEMPYKFFENSFWLKGINETAQKQGIKILLNGARGNHSISFGSWNLTINYYTTLLKQLRWIHLYRELDLYCFHYRTGKKAMLPIILKKAFPQITNLIEKNEQIQYEAPMLINPLLAQKTNIFTKLQESGLDMSGYIENEFEFRRNHFTQLYSWNKTGTIGTKLSLRYSLWDRDPTNDLRVIRFCLAIPEEQYVQGGIERSLIRRATKGILPENVRLNQKIRGIQAADVIHRMSSSWGVFIEELQQLTNDSKVADLLNIKSIKDAISRIGKEPRPEFVFDDDFRLLTRSLIVYRFLSKF
ncbi:asparagine synthase-related protein [Metabacillus rhizolycopersici]|uniref:asparagine synthase (glutamine-hydrolyzing) n=1 Tax=Metabacillus rhizolycopersici TaxID=2875709 RepID=A0ABS7UN03_9BACI|nr:asparagine synthase-related protein [Metabacillus rhizolycopersici]MBZ5749685.1 asparagine synthetase B [Metabacillus rhizolycopersici]